MLTLAVAGLAAGGAYAIFGVSIVVLRRMAGVVNFSQAVVGAYGAYTTAVLTDGGTPLAVAAVVGVVVSTVIAVAVGLLYARLFAESSDAIGTAAMIAITVGLFAAGFRFFGDTPRRYSPILGDSGVTVGGVVVTGATILVLALAGAAVVVTNLILNGTRVGAQVRAISERPVAAELLGVPVYSRAAMVWGATGLVSAVGMILVHSTTPKSFGALGFFIFPAMAAALVGAFRSIGLAFVGGLLVAVAESTSAYLPGPDAAPWLTSTFRFIADNQLRAAVPFLIAVVVLLWTQRNEVWDAAR